MTKKPKPPNPYTKRNRIIVRADNEEFQRILTKAAAHGHKDNLSDYAREAMLNYSRRGASK